MRPFVILLAILLLKPLNAQEMYTLETCETDIAYNVPQFFQDFFHCVKARLSESGNYVNLYFSSLPPYQSWYYDVQNATSSTNPNWIPFESFADGSYQNPNVIAEVDIVISIPVDPTPRTGNDPDFPAIDAAAVDGVVNTSDYEYPMNYIGSALNGATMYNPCAAPGDVIEDEALSFDLYNGHPGGGAYHYHTTSPGPLEVLAYKMPDVVTNTTPGSAEIEIYGINCDGVVIMGCTELDGSAPDPQTWDAQNGHVHDMVGTDGTVYFENRYHTHICYTNISDDDVDDMGLGVGNGYPDHEFTPEISYYKTPGINYPGSSHDRCMALDTPFEPDGVLGSDIEAVPASFALYDNYPNPFNPTTTIDYDLSKGGPVDLAIYDVLGHRVRTLVHGHQDPGFRSVSWDATNDIGLSVPGGLYFYQLKTNEGTQTRKMLILK